MNNRQAWFYPAVLLAGTLVLHTAHAVDSGSTGADGALAPVADVAIAMPPGGILNYTTINIPTNVTVSFFSNASNSPAVVLVQGDAVIDGTIDVSGNDGAGASSSGGGRQGGPGGFDGGLGGLSAIDGGNGYGPGGGPGGIQQVNGIECGGNGGGFALVGGGSPNPCTRSPGEGRSYGSQRLVPLIGGSGGGGGRNGGIQARSGNGGGGGGALLLAASNTVTLNGTIRSTGGDGGNAGNHLGAGGGGSGGAIRIVATTLAGSGGIDVSGGLGGTHGTNGGFAGGVGSFGRIQLEAETVLGTITSLPADVLQLTGPTEIFPANLPVIRIVTVDSIPAPSQPNGVDDVVLSAAINNPVTVEFTASNVPLGTQIQLTMTPQIGSIVNTLSNALTGTVQNSTASAEIDLPQGSSVLSAAVSFTITAANGDLLDRFSKLAAGEAVERVEVVTVLGGGSDTRFITKSGKVFSWPSRALAMY